MQPTIQLFINPAFFVFIEQQRPCNVVRVSKDEEVRQEDFALLNLKFYMALILLNMYVVEVKVERQLIIELK